MFLKCWDYKSCGKIEMTLLNEHNVAEITPVIRNSKDGLHDCVKFNFRISDSGKTIEREFDDFEIMGHWLELNADDVADEAFPLFKKRKKRIDALSNHE